jgi:hypothetical protein
MQPGWFEQAFEETPEAEEIQKWHKSSNVTLPLFLRGLAKDVKASGFQRLLMLWQELRALEILWAEIAEECDGDDLRNRDLISGADDIRPRLIKLLEGASPKRAKKPPEPSAEVLASVRHHVDEAMRMFGFREPL